MKILLFGNFTTSFFILCTHHEDSFLLSLTGGRHPTEKSSILTGADIEPPILFHKKNPHVILFVPQENSPFSPLHKEIIILTWSFYLILPLSVSFSPISPALLQHSNTRKVPFNSCLQYTDGFLRKATFSFGKAQETSKRCAFLGNAEPIYWGHFLFFYYCIFFVVPCLHKHLGTGEMMYGRWVDALITW